MKNLLQLLLLFCILNISFAQNNKWASVVNGLVANASLKEGNTLWIGTNGGLVQYNLLDGSYTTYTKANSDLPDDKVTCITRDIKGNKWLGTLVGWACKV
ncbi:MAG: hypothetical protein IPL98_02465 [Saprospiraceae bacterium]|nr:hypothetical protein [Saprospiraceae bacterium]